MWTEDVPAGQDFAEGFGTEADYQAWMDFEARLRAAGALVEGGDLVPASSGTMVQPTLAGARAGAVPASTPAATSLNVSGFYLVEASDEDAAVALARDMPLYGSVEVRALVSYDGAWDAGSAPTDP